MLFANNFIKSKIKLIFLLASTTYINDSYAVEESPIIYKNLKYSDQLPMTVQGQLSVNKELKILQFQNESVSMRRKIFNIRYLPLSGNARYLLLKAGIPDDDDEYALCNTRYYFFDLSRKAPFKPFPLKEACLDSILMPEPKFYQDRNQIIIHFSASVSRGGERQPNIQYMYSSNKLIYTIKELP